MTDLNELGIDRWLLSI